MKNKYLFVFLLMLGIFSMNSVYANGQVGISSNSAWGGTDIVRILFDDPAPGQQTGKTYSYSIRVNSDSVEVTASETAAATYYADGTISSPGYSRQFHCVMTADTLQYQNPNFQYYHDISAMFNSPGMWIEYDDIGQNGGCSGASLFDANGAVYPSSSSNND